MVGYTKYSKRVEGTKKEFLKHNPSGELEPHKNWLQNQYLS